MKITAGLILAAFAVGFLGIPQDAKAELLTYDYNVTSAFDENGPITATNFSGSYTIDTSLGWFPSGILIGQYVQNPTPLNWGGLISYRITDGSFVFSLPIFSAYYLSVGGPNDIVWGSGLDSGVNTLLGGGITINSDFPCSANPGTGFGYTCTFVGSWKLVSEVLEPPDTYLFVTSLILLLSICASKRSKSRRNQLADSYRGEAFETNSAAYNREPATPLRECARHANNIPIRHNQSLRGKGFFLWGRSNTRKRGYIFSIIYL